jgi:DNA-binding response OmpR family regulator
MKNKILLVEDDATMRMLLKTLLEIEGFEIQVLGDTTESEVFSVLEKGKPTLLLMDVYLRRLNGIEMLNNLRKTPGISQVKVLMTSGLSLGEECLKAGANGFILKPYMPEELIKQLKTLINE